MENAHSSYGHLQILVYILQDFKRRRERNGRKTYLNK